MMNYKDRFYDALAKTKELTLTIDNIKLQHELSVEEIRSMLGVAVKALYRHGYKNSSMLAKKCIPVHLLVQQEIASLLGLTTYITIGDRFWADDDIYCKMSYDDIKTELNSPQILNPIKCHTWLTLTDGTILDFTSEAHLDVITDRGIHPTEKCFQVILPSDSSANSYHRPFLVGDDFLYKTGAVRKGTLPY